MKIIVAPAILSVCVMLAACEEQAMVGGDDSAGAELGSGSSDEALVLDIGAAEGAALVE